MAGSSKVMLALMTFAHRSVVASAEKCNTLTSGTCTFWGCNADHGPTECRLSPNGGAVGGYPRKSCFCAAGYCTNGEDKYHCVEQAAPKVCVVGNNVQVRDDEKNAWVSGEVTADTDSCMVKPNGWTNAFSFNHIQLQPAEYTEGQTVEVGILGVGYKKATVTAVHPLMVQPVGWEASFPADSPSFTGVRALDWKERAEMAQQDREQARKEFAEAATRLQHYAASMAQASDVAQAVFAQLTKDLAHAKKDEAAALSKSEELTKVSHEKDTLEAAATHAAQAAADMAKAAAGAFEKTTKALEEAQDAAQKAADASKAADQDLATKTDAKKSAIAQLHDAEEGAKVMKGKIDAAIKAGQKTLADALQQGYDSASLPAIKAATELVKERTVAEERAQDAAQRAKQFAENRQNIAEQKNKANELAKRTAHEESTAKDEADKKLAAAKEAAITASKAAAAAKKDHEQKVENTKTTEKNLEHAREGMQNADNKSFAAAQDAQTATEESKQANAATPTKATELLLAEAEVPAQDNFVSYLSMMTIVGLVVAALSVKPWWRNWSMNAQRAPLLPQV